MVAPSACAWLAAALCGMAAPPPSYTMHVGRVVCTAAVCPNGRSRLVRVAAPDGVELEYAPGHVLALEPTDADGTPRRGPYTVTRFDRDARAVDVIYRVIAGEPPEFAPEHATPAGGTRKSQLLEGLEPFSSLAFGGRFSTPIFEGVAWEGCKRVFLLSTGVGVGPQLGFVEQCAAAWRAPAGVLPPPVRLFAGYREPGDVVCAEELDDIAHGAGAAPDGTPRFEWRACLSAAGTAADAERASAGRLDACAPALIAAELRAAGVSLAECHFHLVGRGGMVDEWSEALERACATLGATPRLSTEVYFAHREGADEGAVSRIAEGLLRQ